MMDLDLHIHSKFSFDSLMEPKIILKAAKKKNLDVIAVTDHGTIRGGVEVYKIKRQTGMDITVVVGAEIHTNAGDIIGLFLNEEVTCKELKEVIDEIRSQDGLVLLPHPLRGHNLSFVRNFLGEVDLVELLSSRMPVTIEEIKTIKDFRKRFVGCSDAHFPSEIGLCRTTIKESHSPEDIAAIKKLLTKSPIITVKGNFSPPYLSAYSQFIKVVKLRHYRKVLPQGLYTFYRAINLR